ncbi:transposase [Desulforhabdus sp. TSK]|uniref:transposase n=1 Tax=Desulforhabdus sp. TSK TaxID=2925014 RepID=UPI001FC8D05D|nr:transposase [Desulforhabdus sp. TSK]
MKYCPDKHHRRSVRLTGYDYSLSGAYFITICTQNRECIFGEIEGDAMRLSDAGQIAVDSWEWLARQYDHVVLDEWEMMPNHLHAVIVITDDCRGGSQTDGSQTDGSQTDGSRMGGSRMGGSRTAPTERRKPLGRLIGAYKTVSTQTHQRIGSHARCPNMATQLLLLRAHRPQR